MADELEPLRSTLCDLTRRLACLEARVAELEGRPLVVPAGAASAGDGADRPLALPLPQAPLALLGRTLLVLAGAYVVRASTDSRALPAALGVGLGLAYAAFWQLRADREALAGRRQSAAFHDLASSVIAFPLIWETTARFELLPAPAAYALLVAFLGLGLAVAWHRRLVANAALTTLLALATTLALLQSTHAPLVALQALLTIAAGLEWLALHESRGIPESVQLGGRRPPGSPLPAGLRWATAFVLDAVALLLLAVALRPTFPERYVACSLSSAAAALLAIPLLYLTSVAARTLWRGRPATSFDVVQGSAAVLLGCGGAWRLLSAHGLSVALPVGVALLIGALCYGAAFLLVERRAGRGGSFYFYATVGLLLTFAGTSALGFGPRVSLAWDALGIAATVLGRAFDRMTLRVHGALFLTAAAVSTGLVVDSVLALGGGATASLSGPAWVAALAAAVGWLLLASDPRAPRAGFGRTPQLVLALLAVVGLGKAMQLGLWSVLAGPLAQDAGAAAVARTALVAALALGLAGLARRGGLPELGWLVYPLIALGGLRLLSQDLRVGRPATLVVSFALYGLVLMLVPRLTRSREQRTR